MFLNRGRRKACVLYCFMQLLGSLSKQSANYVISWSASICHGLTTSLLSSAFESWLVAEHEKVIKFVSAQFISFLCVVL